MKTHSAIRPALVLIAFIAISCAGVNPPKATFTSWRSTYSREIEIAPSCQCASFNQRRQPGATLSISSYWIYLKTDARWQGEIQASQLLITDQRNRPDHPWYMQTDLTYPWDSPLRGTIFITEKWIEVKLSIPLYGENGKIIGYTLFESNGMYSLAQ